MIPVDQIQLHFSATSLDTLNVIIAIIMFGVALDIRLDDFRQVLVSPKGPIIGLSCQFFIFPAMVFLMTIIMKPQPSIALGLILIAACPGGNFSNFLTHLGGGNTALSVTMSSISTLLAILMTPFNIGLWGNLNPDTAILLRTIQINPFEIFMTILTILLIPLMLGMVTAQRFPTLARSLQKPFKWFSVFFLIAFIILAFKNNLDYFLQYIGMAFIIVLIANSLALLSGYAIARGLGLGQPEARAVSFEVGIQNAGFGLILIFNFFGGLGGMAIIAAWWGVWHIVSGLSLAFFWARKKNEPLQEVSVA